MWCFGGNLKGFLRFLIVSFQFEVTVTAIFGEQGAVVLHGLLARKRQWSEEVGGFRTTEKS